MRFAATRHGMQVARWALYAFACAFAFAAHAIPPEATYVGEKTCIKCHDVEAKHFSHTQHAKIFRENPKNALEARVCEACHGPGSLHAQRGTDRLGEFASITRPIKQRRRTDRGRA